MSRLAGVADRETSLKRARLWLACGVAMPFLYAATLLLAGLLHPGYSHFAQAPSELGAAGVRFSRVFNTGMVATAVATIAGGFGLALGLRQLGAGALLAVMTGGSMALLGISLAMAGLFLLPSPLHHGFGLTLAGLLTPLLGALAWRRIGGAGAFPGVLMLAFIACMALLAINLGAGGLIARTNAGLWPRALAVVCFPSIGLLCWRTACHLVPGAPAAPPA